MKANMEINRDACWIENLCYNNTIPQRLWVALKRDAGADNPWWRSPLAGDLFIREFSSWPKVAWTQTLFGLRPSMSEECIFPTISYQTPSGGPPDYMPCLQGFGPGIPKDQTFEKWSKFIQNTVLDPSKSTAKSATASSHSEPVKPPTASTATAAQGTAP
jgi:hypothetical protein